MGFFSKAMNRYYYGKSGKGDFKESDLPTTRWQLFWEMLRIRLSGLCRLNLMYAVIWLPAMLVILMTLLGLLNAMGDEAVAAEQLSSLVQGTFMTMFLLLAPCIAITGPFTAGVCYVTRNWSRDEHAFIWSDFKDAVKANWKQSLVISAITGVMPLLVYLGWTFYGSMAANNKLMIVPQVLILFVGLVWSISVTYMHPLIVSYELKLSGILRNGILLGLGKLPMSVAIRLLHCVPVILGLGLALLLNNYMVFLGLFLYYILFGFALSRFITASWANAVFDKLINPNIEGAAVNRGLRAETDEDDDEEDEEEDESKTPEEN